MNRLTKRAAIDVYGIVLILGIWLLHGPARPGQLEAPLGKAHTDTSALLTNVVGLALLCACTVDLIVGMRHGGALSRIRKRRAQVKVRGGSTVHLGNIRIGQMTAVEVSVRCCGAPCEIVKATVIFAPSANGVPSEPHNYTEEQLDLAWQAEPAPTVILRPKQQRPDYSLSLRVDNTENGLFRFEVMWRLTVALRAHQQGRPTCKTGRRIKRDGFV